MSRHLAAGIVVLNKKYFNRDTLDAAQVGASAFASTVIQTLFEASVLAGIVLYSRDETLLHPRYQIEADWAEVPVVTVCFNFGMMHSSLVLMLKEAFGHVCRQDSLRSGELSPIIYYQTDALLQFHPGEHQFCVTHHGPLVFHFEEQFSPEHARLAFGGEASKVGVLCRQQNAGIRRLLQDDHGTVLAHSRLQQRVLMNEGLGASRFKQLRPPIGTPPHQKSAALPQEIRDFIGSSQLLLYTAVARLDYFKNVELLIASGISLLRRQISVKILVIGDEEDNSARRQTLLRSIPEDLQNYFLILPRLPKYQLYTLFNHTRQQGVFLCPSRYETLGITPLEAAAGGVTTIITDTPNVEASNYIPPMCHVAQDSASIAAKVESIYDDGIAAWSRMIREYVRSRTSIEGFKQDLLEAWAEMSHKRGQTSTEPANLTSASDDKVNPPTLNNSPHCDENGTRLLASGHSSIPHRPQATAQGATDSKRASCETIAAPASHPDSDLEASKSSAELDHKGSVVVTVRVLDDGRERVSTVSLKSEDIDPPVTQMKWNEPRINLARMALVSFDFLAFGMNDGSYGALLPALESYYSLSYTIVSLLFLTPFAGYALAALLSSPLHTYGGQRAIAFTGPFCRLLTYIIVATHPPFPVVVLVFAVAGFGNGLNVAAWNAYLGTMTSANQVLGVMHACYGLGATISPLIITAMIQTYSLPWWNFFYLMIGLSSLDMLAGTCVFWAASGQEYRRKNIDTRSGVSEKGHTRNAIRNKVTWICAAFLLFYTGTEVTLGGWIVTFMSEVRHGTAYDSGITATGFWLGITSGRVILGFITPRIGERIAVSSYLAIAIILQLIFWLVPSFTISAIMVALQGFFIGPLFPAAVVAATKLLPRKLHVSAIGIASSLGGAGAALLPFVCGAIVNAKGVQTLQPIVLAFLACQILFWNLLPRFPKNAKAN